MASRTWDHPCSHPVNSFISLLSLSTSSRSSIAPSLSPPMRRHAASPRIARRSCPLSARILLIIIALLKKTMPAAPLPSFSFARPSRRAERTSSGAASGGGGGGAMRTAAVAVGRLQQEGQWRREASQWRRERADAPHSGEQESDCCARCGKSITGVAVDDIGA